MFRGRTILPFNTGTASKGPGNFWTDFDDGELWNQDILMVQFFPDAVYAVAVVERDAAKDVLLEIERNHDRLTAVLQLL